MYAQNGLSIYSNPGNLRTKRKGTFIEILSDRSLRVPPFRGRRLHESLKAATVPFERPGSRERFRGDQNGVLLRFHVQFVQSHRLPHLKVVQILHFALQHCILAHFDRYILHDFREKRQHGTCKSEIELLRLEITKNLC